MDIRCRGTWIRDKAMTGIVTFRTSRDLRRTSKIPRHKPGHDEREGGAHAARAALFSVSIRRASTQRK
jgi:hypothetical protein